MNSTDQINNGGQNMTSKAKALSDEIKTGVAKIQNSEDWKEWLDANSKFWNYSFGNQMLIHCQNPKASRVAGFWKWKEFDRSVKKGEHGIGILAPLMVKETDEKTGDKHQVLRGFRAVTVFDVEQTHGKDLPESPFQPLQGEAPQGMFEAVKVFIESRGYSVSFKDTAEGLYGYVNKKKEIVLKTGQSAAMSLDTLCHEAAHGLLGHLEDKEGTRDQHELEAETAAWIVCRNLGLETRQASFAYLASWGQAEDRDKKIEKAAMKGCKFAKDILVGISPAKKAA